MKTIYCIYKQYQDHDSDHWQHYLGKSLCLICNTIDIAEREIARLIKERIDTYSELYPQTDYSNKYLSDVLNNKLYYTTDNNGGNQDIETDLFIIKEMNLITD